MPLLEPFVECFVDQAGTSGAVDSLCAADDGLACSDEGWVAHVDLTGPQVRIVVMDAETGKCHQDPAQAAVEGARREGGDGEGFDMLVEGGVVVLETLVVAQVPWPCPVVDGGDQAGVQTSHTTGSLDILGGRFGLPSNEHQAKAADIHTDGDHVAGEQYIDWGALTLAATPPCWLLG